MTGHAEQCVHRHLELAKIDRKTLKKVATPGMDDHQFAPEDFESKGNLSPVASIIGSHGTSGPSVDRERRGEKRHKMERLLL